VPREALRSMVERDALGALRIAWKGESPAEAAAEEDDEEV